MTEASARDAAIDHLLRDLGQRILDALFAKERDVELERTLHTELRQTLALIDGGETW